MNGSFKFACCDCGLVHDLQFKVVKITKRGRGGLFKFRDVRGYKVGFRARRNFRATAAKRRNKKYAGGG